MFIYLFLTISPCILCLCAFSSLVSTLVSNDFTSQQIKDYRKSDFSYFGQGSYKILDMYRNTSEMPPRVILPYRIMSHSEIN